MALAVMQRRDLVVHFDLNLAANAPVRSEKDQQRPRPDGSSRDDEVQGMKTWADSQKQKGQDKMCSQRVDGRMDASDGCSVELPPPGGHACF